MISTTPLQDLINVIPMEIYDNLEKIDHIFLLLNYHAHNDELVMCHINASEDTGNEFKTKIVNIYREHLNDVLSLQGVYLTNPFEDDIDVLIEILDAISVVSLMKLSEIGLIGIIEDTDDPMMAIAKVINSITNRTIEEILQHIKNVLPETVHYLKQDNELNILAAINLSVSKERFLNLLGLNPTVNVITSIIIPYIQQYSNFGFNIQSFTHAHGNELTDYIDKCFNFTEGYSWNGFAFEVIGILFSSGLTDELLEDNLSILLERVNLQGTEYLSVFNKCKLILSDYYGKH